jgi:hypothetical protein
MKKSHVVVPSSKPLNTVQTATALMDRMIIFCRLCAPPAMFGAGKLVHLLKAETALLNRLVATIASGRSIHAAFLRRRWKPKTPT